MHAYKYSYVYTYNYIHIYIYIHTISQSKISQMGVLKNTFDIIYKYVYTYAYIYIHIITYIFIYIYIHTISQSKISQMGVLKNAFTFVATSILYVVERTRSSAVDLGATPIYVCTYVYMHIYMYK
jgi:hypothetical protein